MISTVKKEISIYIRVSTEDQEEILLERTKFGLNDVNYINFVFHVSIHLWKSIHFNYTDFKQIAIIAYLARFT